MNTRLKKEIKALARDSVREAFEEEVIRLKSFRIPKVTSAEQKQISSTYKKPTKRSVRTIGTRI